MTFFNLKLVCFYHLLLLWLFIPLIINAKNCNANNQCSILPESVSDHEKEKYIINKTKWLELENIILKAQAEYNPPNFNSCECFLNQIKQDLEKFQTNEITFKMFEKSKKFGVHYQIINHRLYREKDCKFPARCKGIEHFILKIVHQLPNLELIINVNDWPQTTKNDILPVFSFSKNTLTNGDILYPAWSFWSGGPVIERHPTGIGRFDILREQLSKIDLKWEEKADKSFFRGSRTSNERDWLILLSKSRPDLLDAKYTKNQAWRSIKDTLEMEPAKIVSFADHCKYKYLINTRGVAASFRYKHLFLCRSLVLNVESNWVEFFYHQLKPWVHYIPVTSENFESRLNFLKSNQPIAKKIALNGFNFIWKYLDLKSIECYWLNLLKQYHSLLKYEPKKLKSMIEIKHF